MAIRSTKNSSGCSLGSIEEAKRVFDKYGKISSIKLHEALDSLSPKAATSEETSRIISEIDKDGDGHIDFDEFLEFFRGSSSSGGADNNDESLKDAFEYYDLDKNGLISPTELHSVLRRLGEKCTLSDCKRMIGSVDKAGTGT